MDHPGAVQRHRVDNSPLHEIDDQWAQSNFNGMSAHPQKNRLVGAMNPGDFARDRLQALRRQDVR